MAVLAGGALRRPSRFRYWRQWVTAYLFLTPWLIFPLVFIAGAIVLAFYFSFTSYDLLSDPVFVGATFVSPRTDAQWQRLTPRLDHPF